MRKVCGMDRQWFKIIGAAKFIVKLSSIVINEKGA